MKSTPKSEASRRTITLPDLIISDLRTHLESYAVPGPDGFVFIGVKGGQLRRSNFSKPWARALVKAGLPGETHFHDLRHTGNTLTVETGASLAELMSRMGHSSMRPLGCIYTSARSGTRRSPRLSTGWRNASWSGSGLAVINFRFSRQAGSGHGEVETAHDDQRFVRRTMPLNWSSPLERVTGIEPALSAWEMD